MNDTRLAHPKPEKRITTKRRKVRVESLTKQKVRADVDARDGDCRVAKDFHTTKHCRGESEWAHFGKFKRARTRGQAPARRHTTAGSLKLCTQHHQNYDAGLLLIRALDEVRGCDAELAYTGRL